MKQHLRLATALAAGAFVVGVFASNANAITITNVTQDLAFVPVTGNQITPDFGVGTVNQITPPPGSSANVYRSPFQDFVGNNLPQANTAAGSYTAVESGNAGFNLTGTSLSLFWGSPDLYNSITFYTGLNGTGNSVTESGADLSYGFYGFGHDQVSIFLDTVFESVVLTSTSAAFEFTNLTASCGPEGGSCAPPQATPLPAALPLFGSIIAGAGGVFRWRKKRKAGSKALAPA
jgi:hypothetical protein